MPDAPQMETAHRLRDALTTAGFTYDTVAELLGPLAHSALSRNETVPGRRRTTGGSPVETLARLFLLQTPVELAAAERALPGLVDRLAVEGVLEQSVGQVAARMDVRPYDAGRDLWVVSDLTPGLDGGPQRVSENYVLGISPASTSLAQLTIRTPVAKALDLGTGCGVQALHLAEHADRVVATDVNKRALWVTRFNAALNDVADRVDVRDGSFFEPVAHETFDLIATNPPFVISPATGERLVYRDSGLPGDRVVEDIVSASPARLNEGGWCQILANWIISADRSWDERLASWLTPGVDALVVQREVLDPAEYVELWLKDAGQHGAADYLRRYDTWLSWMEDQRIEGVGFGWINLHKTGGSNRELLDYPYAVEQPIAPAIAAWGAVAGATATPADRLTLAEDVVQETLGAPGAEDPSAIVLRQQRGLRRGFQADTVTAAMVGASDGELTVDQIAGAIARLTGADASDTLRACLDSATELLRQGFLTR